MIKYILLILICFSGVTQAGDPINETNIIYQGDMGIIGGSDYVTPHLHYWDNWFSLYNAGGVSYQVYMSDYDGVHPDNYTNSFIGIVNPNQVITLTSNASYKIYAVPDNIQGVTVETIEKRFNQYWLIGVLIIIMLIVILKIYQVIKR